MQFAKLFDVKDSQVLAMVTQSECGEPCLKMTTSLNGMEMSVNAIFKGDAGWDKAEKALLAVQQETADKFYVEVAEKLAVI